MTRCHHCGLVVPLDDQHTFAPGTVYHGRCCPQCRTEAGFTMVPPAVEPGAVERAKRGHRRGTPKAWALRGVGS